MCWSCGHEFEKHLWCACKSTFMACMNLIYLSCELYCDVLIFPLCLVTCDELCLLTIIVSCHNVHTCVGSPQIFAKVHG
jgi:hypothetical protein